MNKFVIIDGNNICFRSFYALPMLQNFEGVVSNAVFGFANTIVKIIEEYKPEYIAVAFDKGKKTFRHQMYKDYKALRRPTPKELLSQIPLLKEMLSTMNIKYLELDEIEADDIIGVLSRKFDTENIIVSADKDVLQLINNNTSVYAPQKGGDAILYNEDKLKEIMGVSPSQIIELKALMGDSSDNIKGVEGVGEKTALSLITKYNDIDGVYANIDDIGGKQREKLVRDKDSAYFSKKLATIVTDYDMAVSLDDFKYDYPFGDDTLEFFKKYQFNSLLKKSSIFGKDGDSTTDIEDQTLDIIKDDKYLSSALRDISLAQELYLYLDDDIFSIFDGNKEYNFAIKPNLLDGFVDITRIFAEVGTKLEDKDFPKYFYDAKTFMHLVYNYGIKVNGITFDCMLAKYLINSNLKPISFETAISYFSLSLKYRAKNIKDMVKQLQSKIEELDLKDLYYSIELPLISILFDMEIAGIKIDSKELKELDDKYRSLIEELTEEIYDMAGSRFNINSPKQLGEILFGSLGLSAKQNKKDSTNIAVLNELVGQHPIVKKIIDYRQYYKLYSTYIKTYQDYKDSEDKVHTTFNQTLTATGRLSSQDPNLQNIPSKSNEAKVLRKIFIPSDPNGKLISADYSQIELRLLANFCQDERLITAYNSGKDIHAITASEIFGIPLEMVTPFMRSSAKAVNFGIIYGMSDWGLSQNIGITKVEAGEYIKRYFEKYPLIEKYMKGNVDFAKEYGYIKTIKGRIRYIPELKGKHMQQLFGERVAMNMPLQGSASDIIKMAMIAVYNAFVSKGLKSKLILQIHDELICDVVAGEEEIVAEILKTCMETVCPLDVKLEVNISSGDNLSEAK